MSLKIQTWDVAKAKQEITKRFKNAAELRSRLEDRWTMNEQAVYDTGAGYAVPNVGESVEFSSLTNYSVDGSDANVNVAYTFKNVRFLHAQMSANPPSVVMRPTSSDQDDHRRADAADRIVRHSIRHYKLQEKQDQLTLSAIIYGTGVVKTVWDAGRGDIIKFDEESGEIQLDGDICISNPFLWNIYIDPDAKAIDEIKWIIERVYIDFEEAAARWPDKIDILKKAKIERSSAYDRSGGRQSLIDDERYNCVELLEYWETGLPTNGYLGRHCISTTDGDLVSKLGPNPFRFRQAGSMRAVENMDITDEEKAVRLARIPEMARLPYHILTDIDVPNIVWGRATVDYAAQLQDNLARLDSAIMDNIQAHGTARMVIPDRTEIQEVGLSNSPWNVTKITGNQPPYFMEVPSLMPEMAQARLNYINGINEVFGVNEAMFGQQSREQSGASMQYATNQGNMIRRRLFNKYVISIESIFTAILDLVRKHWTTERTIHILGKENAMEAIDLKGSDIDGGYDVVGEYGVSLSLDPITRREEILTLQPLFEKAGVPHRTLMRLLKLNELESMYDKIQLAENRQKEIFDEMIASGRYIPPEDLMDHQSMIAWALDYFMTSEFKYLEQEARDLCKQHIRDRTTLAAQEAAGAGGPAGAVPQPPGPVPQEAAGAVPLPAGQPTPASGV